MTGIELPLGRRRTRAYRLLEMLPALLSFGFPLLIVAVSLIDAQVGAVLVLAFIGLAVLRAARGAVDAIRGYRALRVAERANWAAMNAEVEELLRARRAGGAVSEHRSETPPRSWATRRHAALLAAAAIAPEAYPLPSEVVHAVIVTAYNEPYEVVERSIQAVAEATIGPERLIVLLAIEARGGEAMRATAARLERKHGDRFRAFGVVEHPADLSDEIPGKGANLSNAGRHLHRWLAELGVDERFVVVTSLDCDNRPHPQYFASVTYEFVRAVDRERVSFQPVSLFVNNIWHAPAPMRIIASGNSLWNLISTVRPFGLRNFASHAQPMSALVEMDYWSRRTITEDGHQFWRSYFHFRGRYRVIAVRLPIYQDAVLTERLTQTLKTQFTQLSRWAYGASDVPYVGVRVFSRARQVPFWRSVVQFVLLVESHVSLATIAPLVIFGAWTPLLVTTAAGWLHAPGMVGRPCVIALSAGTCRDDFVHSLPGIIDVVLRAAMPCLIVTIIVTGLLLPARPRGIGRVRSFAMVAQWLLLPVIAIAYNAAAAMSSQGRLLIGLYSERFHVTEKIALPERECVAEAGGRPVRSDPARSPG